MYTGKEKTVITPEFANSTIGEALQNRHMDFTSTYLSRDAAQELLNIPNAVGLRLYTAKIEEEGQPYKTLIAVAVDADGNDLLQGGEVVLCDLPCPRHCPDGGGNVWP